MPTEAQVTAWVPQAGSGASMMRYMRSAAAMPPVAVWKNEPSVRSGMKKSAARNTKANAPAKVTVPAA